jgi:hypothetical protein
LAVEYAKEIYPIWGVAKVRSEFQSTSTHGLKQGEIIGNETFGL